MKTCCLLLILLRMPCVTCVTSCVLMMNPAQRPACVLRAETPAQALRVITLELGTSYTLYLLHSPFFAVTTLYFFPSSLQSSTSRHTALSSYFLLVIAAHHPALHSLQRRSHTFSYHSLFLLLLLTSC